MVGWSLRRDETGADGGDDALSSGSGGDAASERHIERAAFAEDALEQRFVDEIRVAESVDHLRRVFDSASRGSKAQRESGSRVAAFIDALSCSLARALCALDIPDFRKSAMPLGVRSERGRVEDERTRVSCDNVDDSVGPFDEPLRSPRRVRSSRSPSLDRASKKRVSRARQIEWSGPFFIALVWLACVSRCSGRGQRADTAG